MLRLTVWSKEETNNYLKEKLEGVEDGKDKS
jgi:hypothetical protein